MARYVFITGGVVSSLGKGLASAALGALLKSTEGAAGEVKESIGFRLDADLGMIELPPCTQTTN